MQLSLHADYSLRVLLFLGASPDKVYPTHQISEAYGISRNHLVRVVQTLAEHGYVTVTAGRSGGVRLGMTPDKIRLGEVVRNAEPNLKLVECFDRLTNTCPIAPACRLKASLRNALEAFLAELNKQTLADMLDDRGAERLERILLSIGPQTQSA